MCIVVVTCPCYSFCSHVCWFFHLLVVARYAFIDILRAPLHCVGSESSSMKRPQHEVDPPLCKWGCGRPHHLANVWISNDVRDDLVNTILRKSCCSSCAMTSGWPDVAERHMFLPHGNGCDKANERRQLPTPPACTMCGSRTCLSMLSS